jgi:hypothetical protein
VVGEVVGVVVGVVGAVVGGVVTVAPPVQVVPLTAKLTGTGLLPVQVPLKPNEVVALVARLLFQPASVAVTVLPLCVKFAFQPWLTVCPAGNDHLTVQDVSGSPRLVRATSAPKPPAHCDATV